MHIAPPPHLVAFDMSGMRRLSRKIALWCALIAGLGILLPTAFGQSPGSGGYNTTTGGGGTTGGGTSTGGSSGGGSPPASPSSLLSEMLFYVEAHPDATSAELEHEFLWLADDYENANGTFVAAYMAAMANPYVQEQLAVQSANAPNAPAMFATVNPIYPKPGPELPAPLPPVPVVPNQILGCPPGLLDCPIVKHISDKPEYFIIYDRYFEYDIFTVHNLHPNGYPFEVQFTYQEVTTEEWEGVGMPVFLGVRNSYKNGAKKLKDYKEVRDLNKQLSDNNALYASVCLALATIPSQQYLISGFAVYAYYTIKYKGLADDAQTWVRHYDETELPILYRQITTGDELPKLLDEKVSASVPWVIPIQSGNVTTLPPVNTRLPSPQSGFDLTTGWEWIDQHVTVVGNTRNEAIGKLPSELQTLFRSATGF